MIQACDGLNNPEYSGQMTVPSGGLVLIGTGSVGSYSSGLIFTGSITAGSAGAVTFRNRLIVRYSSVYGAANQFANTATYNTDGTTTEFETLNGALTISKGLTVPSGGTITVRGSGAGTGVFDTPLTLSGTGTTTFQDGVTIGKVVNGSTNSVRLADCTIAASITVPDTRVTANTVRTNCVNVASITVNAGASLYITGNAKNTVCAMDVASAAASTVSIGMARVKSNWTGAGDLQMRDDSSLAQSSWAGPIST